MIEYIAYGLLFIFSVFMVVTDYELICHIFHRKSICCHSVNGKGYYSCHSSIHSEVKTLIFSGED